MDGSGNHILLCVYVFVRGDVQTDEVGVEIEVVST